MLLAFLAKQTNKKLLFAGPCGVTSQARASLKQERLESTWQPYYNVFANLQI